MTRNRSRSAATCGAHMLRLKGCPWTRTTAGPCPASSCARSTAAMRPMVTGSRAAGCPLAEEVAEGGDDQVRRFLGDEVTGGLGLAADVDGVFLPDAERLVVAADDGLRAPQHQDRAFELPARGEGLVVVDEVDAGRRAVVGARARDGPRVAEAADVVLHDVGRDARARAEQRADDRPDPVSGVRADHVLG